MVAAQGPASQLPCTVRAMDIDQVPQETTARQESDGVSGASPGRGAGEQAAQGPRAGSLHCVQNWVNDVLSGGCMGRIMQG